MPEISDLLVVSEKDIREWKEANEVYSFLEYFTMVQEDPKILRSSWKFLFDMVLSYGTETRKDLGEELLVYKFFDHPDFGEDIVFGLERTKARLMRCLEAGANELGPEHRILLLTGPVGSSKSTLARLMKRGLEKYSLSNEGRVFSFSWITEADKVSVPCPLNEQPFKLIPLVQREEVLRSLGIQNVKIEGELCPLCRGYWDDILANYHGDWVKMIEERILVRRVIFSESRRIGIGTFQPKDPKDQDVTELLGDVNYKKLAELGVESSPFAYSYDGEFLRSNRGLLELIELLKCDVTFLYEFLGAAQEHAVKPKKFTQVNIDEVLISHSNRPEFDKLMKNEFMEAFRDRTIRVDVPYLLKLDDETKIYQKTLKTGTQLKKHLAPHTVEMAAMWVILTRLEKPKQDLSLLQKLKLYNGKTLPNWTETKIKELRNESTQEGMDGISPRYIQDKISNALVNASLSLGEDADPLYPAGCVNPFMVLNEIEEGLIYCTLITSEEKREHYKKLVADVKAEYEEIVKTEVQKAISADEEALERLLANYIDNIQAYCSKEKVKNVYTGKDENPNEKLMRSIEEKIDIPENRTEDFRREILAYIGAILIRGQKFTYTSNERLQKALEKKLVEDSKDQLRMIMAGVNSSNPDKEQLSRIETVRGRLINEFGYCELCSNDILSFVASIFNRGDAQEVK